MGEWSLLNQIRLTQARNACLELAIQVAILELEKLASDCDGAESAAFRRAAQIVGQILPHKKEE